MWVCLRDVHLGCKLPPLRGKDTTARAPADVREPVNTAVYVVCASECDNLHAVPDVVDDGSVTSVVGDS